MSASTFQAVCPVRFKRGSVLIEFLVGLLVLVPVILVVLDLALIVLAVQVGDTACREAARAAATGDPRNARARAQAVISSGGKSAGGLVTNLRLIGVSSTVPVATLAQLSLYGGQVDGSVTVQTSIDVHPFLVHWAY